MIIVFSGMEVSYEKFIHDLAREMASVMKKEAQAPEYVSQRRASRMFGRANVERWRHSGRIQPIKRPGKILYRLSELQTLYEDRQDY